jgi:hypothetical protein
MKTVLESPWFAVVLAIVVMTAGYTMYLSKNGELASANNYFCPAEELCKKEGCNGTSDCSKSECTGCPFCNIEAS